MTREEARELISKHSYKDELGRYVIYKKVAFIIADCLENEYLQNKKCSNCKYATLDSARYLPIHKCLIGCNKVSYDFSCSEWESK